MKTALFWLYLITPDGNQWAMDSHMSQEDCGAAIVEGFQASLMRLTAGMQYRTARPILASQ